MSGQSRNAILSKVLIELKDQEITVTGVRDIILQKSPDEVMNSAALRRWVNGQFVTMVKKGIMTKLSKSGGRKSFFLVSSDIEKSSYVQKCINNPSTTRQRPSGQQSCSLSTLREELEGHRLRALTELSEIDEYKRIINHYPELSEKTKLKFNSAIEENCKTLGRIKALEKVLEYKELHS